MVTVVQEPGLFGPGFQQGIGALAQGLQDRGTNQRQQQARGALEEALAAGEKDPLKIMQLAQAAGYDEKAVMKALEMGQPTLLDELIKEKQQNVVVSPEDQIAQDMGVKEPDNIMDDENFYEKFNEDDITRLANSKNPRDREVAKSIQEQKKQARSVFTEDRAYHSKVSDKVAQEMDVERDVLMQEESSLRELEMALDSGKLGALSPDDFANRFSVFKGFTTPEGALFLKGIKDYFIKTLGGVSAKGLNMFLEKVVASALPEIGKSDEANKVILAAMRRAHEIRAAKVKAHDELSEFYTDRDGFVPRDIKKQTNQRASQEIKNIEKQTNFDLKTILDNNKSTNDLEKEINKKVVKDTPLTVKRLKVFEDKFGDQAIKQAELRGYSVFEDKLKASSNGVEANEVVMMLNGKKVAVSSDRVEEAMQQGATRI